MGVAIAEHALGPGALPWQDRSGPVLSRVAVFLTLRTPFPFATESRFS